MFYLLGIGVVVEQWWKNFWNESDVGCYGGFVGGNGFGVFFMFGVYVFGEYKGMYVVGLVFEGVF